MKVALAVFASLVLIASTLLVCWTLWSSLLRGLWRRVPLERRRAVIVAELLLLASTLGVGALLVFAPWGKRTVLYLAVGSLVLLLAERVVFLVVQLRRARRRRWAAPD
jgi:hypothetical protein